MPAISNPERGSSRWFAVQTRAQCEDIALRHLTHQRFTSFCPRARLVRKVGRHTVDRLAPFFRGYVFVKLDLERERWRSVNSTVGVARLVTFDRLRPSPLPVGLVERLQELCGNDSELGFADELAVGDPVKVMAGPFAELVGTLEAASGPERVTILLDVLARSTRVELPRALVARAD